MLKSQPNRWENSAGGAPANRIHDHQHLAASRAKQPVEISRNSCLFHTVLGEVRTHIRNELFRVGHSLILATGARHGQNTSAGTPAARNERHPSRHVRPRCAYDSRRDQCGHPVARRAPTARNAGQARFAQSLPIFGIIGQMVRLGVGLNAGPSLKGITGNPAVSAIPKSVRAAVLPVVAYGHRGFTPGPARCRHSLRRPQPCRRTLLSATMAMEMADQEDIRYKFLLTHEDIAPGARASHSTLLHSMVHEVISMAQDARMADDRQLRPKTVGKEMGKVAVSREWPSEFLAWKSLKRLAPQVGFEPTTLRVTAEHLIAAPCLAPIHAMHFGVLGSRWSLTN